MGVLFGESIDTRSPVLARLTNDGEILRQWVELCLGTAPGTLWSAPEFGAGVRQLVGKGITPAVLGSIPGQVAAQIRRRRGIADVDVTATTTYLASGQAAIKLDIVVTPVGAGPIELVATASRDLVKVILKGL